MYIKMSLRSASATCAAALIALTPIAARAQVIVRAVLPEEKILPTQDPRIGVLSDTKAYLLAGTWEFADFQIVVYNNTGAAISNVDVVVDTPPINTTYTSSTYGTCTVAAPCSIPAGNIVVYREAYIPNDRNGAHPSYAASPLGYWPDILIPKRDEYGYSNSPRCAFYAMGDEDNASLSACNSACNSGCSQDFIPPGKSRVFFVDILVNASAPTLPPTQYLGQATVSWTANNQPQSQGVPIVLEKSLLDLRSWRQSTATAILLDYYRMGIDDIARAENLNTDPSQSWGPVGAATPDTLAYHAMRYARFVKDHWLTPVFIYNMIDSSPLKANPSAQLDWTPFQTQYGQFINGTDPYARLQGVAPSVFPFSWEWRPNIYQPGAGQDSLDQAEHREWQRVNGTTIDVICDEPQSQRPHWDCGFQKAIVSTVDGTLDSSWSILHRLALNAKANSTIQRYALTDFHSAQTNASTTFAQDIDLFAPVVDTLWGKKPNNAFSGNHRGDYPVDQPTISTIPTDWPWWYHSCDEVGCGTDTTNNEYYPSLAIDIPPSAPTLNRIMEWLSMRYQMQGESYWGITNWSADPTRDSTQVLSSAYRTGENGDGILIYPGLHSIIGPANGSRADDIPLASLRLKAVRDGMQDALYLKSSTIAECTGYHPSYNVLNGWIDTLFGDGLSPPAPYDADRVRPYGLLVYRARANTFTVPGCGSAERMTLNPTSVAIVAGQNATINISSNYLVTGLMSLGLPKCVTGVTLGASQVSSNTPTTMTISTDPTCSSLQSGPIGVIGQTDSSTTFSMFSDAPVMVSVQPNPVVNFTASSSLSRVSAAPGTNVANTIAVQPLNGFNATVSLGVSGNPAGSTAQLASNTVSSANNWTTTLTLGAGSATAGSYRVTVTATSGALQQVSYFQFDVPYVADSTVVLQGGTSDSDYSNAVAVDSSGNIYVAGGTRGSLPGFSNQGLSDAMLVKYNSQGVQQWAQEWGTTGDEVATSIALDGSGNVFVAGYTSGNFWTSNSGGRHDGFVSAHNSSGSELWTNLVGTSDDDEAFGVAVDAGGNIYVALTTWKQKGDRSSQGSDAHYGWVAKYNQWWKPLWTAQFGSTSTSALALALDATGNPYVCGSTGEALGGPGAGGADAFIARLTPAGAVQWISQLGSAGDDACRSLAVDASGNIAVGGSTTGALGGASNGGTDAWIAKYSNAGVLGWTSQLGSAADDWANSVAADPGGNLYLAGQTRGALSSHYQGQWDAFVAKYSSTGVRQWIKSIGSAGGDDLALGIAADATYLYVTGTTTEVLAGAAFRQSYEDTFVAKLAQ